MTDGREALRYADCVAAALAARLHRWEVLRGAIMNLGPENLEPALRGRFGRTFTPVFRRQLMAPPDERI
jgi:hypothetical protein